MTQIAVINNYQSACSFGFPGRKHVDKKQTMTPEEIFRCLSVQAI